MPCLVSEKTRKSAQKEAHDKVMARREQARAAATAAAEKVERNIKSAGDSVKSAGDAAAKKWTAFQTKISNDLQSIKEGIAQKKHDLDVRQAEKYADRLEWEAGSPSITPLPLLNRRNWPSLMLWPAGSKLHKLSETSWVVSKPYVEALNHVRAIERRGCGATTHPRPHATDPSKNLSKYAEASPRSARPTDKRELLQFSVLMPL
jgi:hypothetical protein